MKRRLLLCCFSLVVLACSGLFKCKSHTASTSISSTATTLHVGDVVTVTVTLNNEGCVELGLPQYRLQVRSQEPGSFLEPSDPEPIVHSLGVEPGESDTADFVLRGAEAGRATLSATASFEVHLGYPGPAYWGASGSERALEIVILP